MQGYYSLIQYCPDWTRLEVCNIGVLLFCPEQKYLDVEMSPKNKRIHTIFGKNHSLDYIKTFKESFANRIRVERENINELNDLKMFIARRANNFIITEPRSIAVDNPQQELVHLFTEIFGETLKTTPHPKRPSIKQKFLSTLERKLGDELDNRVVINLPEIRIPIPGVHKTISPCAGFMNGLFNIVLNERFTPKDSFQKISCDTMIGKFLHDKENEQWGKQRLLILADIVDNEDNEVKQQLEAFHPTMQAYKIELYTDVKNIVTTISKEAKELPERLRVYTKDSA
jgi:hypothetical protein